MPQDQQMQRKADPVRILIADDHELARAGLRSLLTGERGLELVGEATNGREAIALCTELRPDLVLLDVRMPEIDGLAATRVIKQTFPNTSVIIISVYENPDYMLEAIRAGASGYVLKDATRDELIRAMRQVIRGESILKGDLAVRLLRRLAIEPPPSEQLLERLTPREREVLYLLAKGQTNPEIAYNLSIRTGTVKIHVEHIIAKLNVSDRTQAAVRAIELGLIGTVRV